MIGFRTGNEPDHKVCVNPVNVSYIKPRGSKWCYIVMVTGDSFLVDTPYDIACDVIRMALKDKVQS